jgi:hypothetical protein
MNEHLLLRRTNLDGASSLSVRLGLADSMPWTKPLRGSLMT